MYGWSAILQRLGDPDAGIMPTLFIHKRCARLLECLPYLQHDPDRPGDVLKTNINEDGVGGDDAADAFRYMVATKPPEIFVRRLIGLSMRNLVDLRKRTLFRTGVNSGVFLQPSQISQGAD